MEVFLLPTTKCVMSSTKGSKDHHQILVSQPHEVCAADILGVELSCTKLHPSVPQLTDLKAILPKHGL